MHDEVAQAIAMLGTALAGSEAELTQYDTRLNALIDQYADYYLAQYVRFRLSSADANRRDALLGSDQKRTADVLADVELLSKGDYESWRNQLANLRPADVNITKARVKEEPYHDFNPREYVGKSPVTVSALTDQLTQTLEQWTKALRSVFKDPSAQDNLDLLTAADRQLAASFRDGHTEIDTTNAAQLRSIVQTLSQGMDKVEISFDDLRQQLDKPLSPNEAIDALTQYINQLCAGKERNKVRILIK